MADEDDKELDLDVGDEKPKSKLMLIIIIVVVLLGGIVAAVFFLMGGEEEEEEVVEEVVEEVKMLAIYVPMKPVFVVNFATPGTKRFLQVEVTLMTRDNAVVAIIEQHIPLLRNNLVALFSAQQLKDVATAEGKEALRQSALEVVQQVVEEEIGDPGVEQVLFTSFVIQ